MTEQERRALGAYYRAGASITPDSPITTTVDGREYIVLRNGHGVLAVYRVLAHRDALKRLRRWPAEIGLL